MLPESLSTDDVAIGLDSALPEAIAGAKSAADGPVIEIAAQWIVPVCRHLKNIAGFERLGDQVEKWEAAQLIAAAD